MSVCNRNCVILQTNGVRCILYKKILDLLYEETVSGACSGRASLYKFEEKSTVSLRKGKSNAKVQFKLIWGHIYTYIYINEHQHRSHKPLLAHARAG